jgi:LysM repeat protein
MFILHNPNSQAVNRQSISSSDEQAISPLDTLSSADIAVSAARMANLAETASVTSQAYSVAAELNTKIVDYAVVPKPQILSSVIKTKADIKDYTVVTGDTLGDLASRYGVTSDSIKWTNGLTSNTLRPGTSIAIPPVDGIVYTIKSGDTADTLASKYSANKDQIIAFNDAEVSGLKVSERIVIPGGSIPAPVAVVSYFAPYVGNVSGSYGGNGYDYGWCTWYVSNRRAELGRPVPNNLGNAYSWYTIAQRIGLSTGTSPQVGAVMVLYYGPSSPTNHVAVVERINDDGSFWISEMNSYGQVSIDNSARAGGWGRINWKLYGSVGNNKFIY